MAGSGAAESAVGLAGGFLPACGCCECPQNPRKKSGRRRRIKTDLILYPQGLKPISLVLRGSTAQRKAIPAKKPLASEFL